MSMRSRSAVVLGAMLTMVGVVVAPGPAQAATIPTLARACQPLVAGTATITSFASSPGTLDVTHSSKVVTFTVKAHDTGAITRIDAEISPPRNSRTQRFTSSSLVKRVSGTSTNGTCTGTATIPRYADPGSWHTS